MCCRLGADPGTLFGTVLLMSLCVFTLCFCSVQRELASVHTQSICDCVLFLSLFFKLTALVTCLEKKENHLSVLIFVTSFKKELFSMESRKL